MATDDAIHNIGQNTELLENENGRTVLRNTLTGASITLTDAVELGASLGSESEPIPGTTHLEAVSTESATVENEPVESNDVARKEEFNKTLKTVEKINVSDDIVEVDLPDVDLAVISLTRVSPASDGEVRLQLSTDGGSSWLDDDDYNYVFDQKQSDGTDRSNNSESADHITIGEFESHSGTSRNPVRIVIPNPQSQLRPRLSWTGTANRDFESSLLIGSGSTEANQSVDKLRIFGDDGIGDMLQVDGFIKVEGEDI